MSNEVRLTVKDMIPCPFCGSTDLSTYTLHLSEDWGAGCDAPACGAEMNGYETEAEAVAAWNLRVKVDAPMLPPELLKALEKPHLPENAFVIRSWVHKHQQLQKEKQR